MYSNDYLVWEIGDCNVSIHTAGGKPKELWITNEEVDSLDLKTYYAIYGIAKTYRGLKFKEGYRTKE